MGSAGMVGEVAVELGEEDLHLEGQPLEDLGGHQAAHPVGRVGHHLQGTQRPTCRRTSARGRRRRRAPSAARSGAQRGRVGSGGPSAAPLVEQRLGRGLDLGQAGVAADGAGPGQAELQPVVPGRVVGGGEHGPGGVEAAGGEVEQVGRGEAEVDDVGALGPGAEGERLGQLDARTRACPGPPGSSGPPVNRATATPMARNWRALSSSGTTPRMSYALKTWEREAMAGPS